MNRLDRFLNVDDKARQRVLNISAVVGFLWFGLVTLVFGVAGKVAGYSTLVLVSSVYLAGLWYYCTSRTVPIPKGRSFVTLGHGLGLTFTTAAILALLYLMPAARVQANILRRRLVAATGSATLSGRQLNDVTNALQMARNNRVALPSPILLKVRDALMASASAGESGTEVSQATSALGQYSKIIESDHEDQARFQAARNAVSDCLDRVISSTGPRGIIEPNAQDALSACERAIDVADGLIQWKIIALQVRAMFEILMKNQDAQALADADKAQKLGSLELATIFYVKGIALSRSPNLADKKQAITFLILCTHMDPSSIVGPTYLYYGGVFSSLAETSYDLGDYDRAATSARQALTYVPVTNPLGGDLYRLIIVSDLQVGKQDAAMRVGLEFLEKARNQQAASVVQMLTLYHSDPQRAIAEIGPDFK